MEFIDLKAQYQQVENKIKVRIDQVLSHGKYIMGPEVQELEEKLADYVGVKHCISCANGTDALQLALMAMGVGPGDVVFVPSFTFFATAEAVALVGAKPVFVDVDARTYNICTDSLESSINQLNGDEMSSAKAIISVDLFGLPADYSKLEEIAKRHGLYLIEDGAQAMGGEVGKKKSCSFGDIGTTSFFPAKPLGCYGDGGALFTNNDELAVMLKSLRVHGKGKDKYDNVRIGMNSRLDTLQAAILLEKLNILPVEIIQRNVVADRYKQNLNRCRLNLPFVPEGYCSSWAQFTVQVESERTNIMQKLKGAGVPSVVYYPTPLHRSVAFKKHQSADLMNSQRLANSVMSLPMHPYMSNGDVDGVCEHLIEAIG